MSIHGCLCLSASSNLCLQGELQLYRGEGFASLWVHQKQSYSILAMLLLVPATLERTQRSAPEKGRKESQVNQTDNRRKAQL